MGLHCLLGTLSAAAAAVAAAAVQVNMKMQGCAFKNSREACQYTEIQLRSARSARLIPGIQRQLGFSFPKRLIH